MINLQNVSITNNKKVVFNNINFNVNSGEFVFLIGKTGTGKSSLLRILYGDTRIKSGTGDILGFDLNSLKDKEIPLLRRKLGVVFQDFKLLTDRSIYDNLTFVLRATGWKDKLKIQKRVEEVLSMVNIDLNYNKYPFELSGGEQQRVAIARALLNSPKLLIADEPTGNLDPETSKEIMQLFKKLHQGGISVIMATHDYNMIIKFPGKIFQCNNEGLEEVVTKNK